MKGHFFEMSTSLFFFSSSFTIFFSENYYLTERRGARDIAARAPLPLSPLSVVRKEAVSSVNKVTKGEYSGDEPNSFLLVVRVLLLQRPHCAIRQTGLDGIASEA